MQIFTGNEITILIITILMIGDSNSNDEIKIMSIMG